MGKLKFFLIAGEASGDALGKSLMAGFKELCSDRDVVFSGIGGPLMQQEGLESLFPMQELSLMGFVEVLPHYFHLKRRVSYAAEAAIASGADALITIDSPSFCTRVAKIVRAKHPDMKIIHYVAPSVWAWRAKRAKKMAGLIDHVLALLPFEPPYMEAAGMSCDFVGHPVVAEPLAGPREIAELRARISGGGPILLALPGSRKSEVSRLAPVFGEVIERVKVVYPEVQVLLPSVPHMKDMVRDMASRWPCTPLIIEDQRTKRAAFAVADAALAASGTVSLELAANDCPMVIAYNMNLLTLAILKFTLLVDTVTLVNLVSGSRAVSEFLGPRCRADKITPAVIQLIKEGSKEQSKAMKLTMEKLGRGQEVPGIRAARSVLSFLASG